MHLDAEALLREYGCAAVLIGTFFEGETIVLAGTWAAGQGYLSLPQVVGCALVGSFAGDQFYFLLGRWFGQPWLAKRPRLAEGAARVLDLLARYQTLFIIAFRFLYGLRTVAPIVLGASGMPSRVFMPLNFVGALLWSVIITFGGAALLELVRFVAALPAAGAVASVAIALLLPLVLAGLAFGIDWLGRHRPRR